ncbi:MAG TPA: alkaline phosphatase family protein [Bryobacteraceae bacterium]|nr:alkaline phosphatase family protein [Bryobacteraceae bacterium]HXJ39910.1 alkaline phosphatase family protein [Bryobacteraceae bacterium]
MLNKRDAATIVCSIVLLVAPKAYAEHINERNGVRHVLLISIDGMHALDYENCVSAGSCPNLAALGQNGVNYTRTSSSKPSDSFPGLMALVTGGTPRTVGAFYDVAYDRVLAPPQNTTGNGVAGGVCTAGVANGTTTEYEEGVDIDQSQLNGGGPYSLTDGGIKSIDPTRLPRDPFNNCSPVYPWNFIRTNTIYGVIHAAGGYTAWSDKHAVYAAVSGPSYNASNVDDYYSPDVNSNVIALPGVTTPTGLVCSVSPDPNGGAWTDSFQNIKCYDTLKVNAILNEIGGKTHDGLHKAPVPTIFGMNFQAVNVGQKLIEKNVKGGYTDAAGTPTAAMLGEIEFVDASIGQMVTALKKQNLLESTLVIITAKHGQSPIDTNRFFPIPGHSGANGTTPADLIAAFLPFSESPVNPTGIGPTQDDISQLWLAHSSDTLAAVAILEANAASAGIGQIFYGPSLETMFNAPGLPPNGDPRTPDIIVQPNVGVIYTGSSKKQAEHGGFAHDDTNVMLLVSNPDLHARTVTSFVETTQVAPTILQALGLDPNDLDAVQKEGTPVLPGLGLK